MSSPPPHLRIVVHDYSGHPFQVQLSRELAERGHTVWHITSADFQTPKGRLAADVPDGRLTILNLSLGTPFLKDSLVRRRAQEAAFGKLVGAEIRGIQPDVVISSNAPLDAQRQIQKAAQQVGASFVFWVQDLYGEAISRILKTKLGPPGQAIGEYYKGLERRMLRASDAVVVISNDFVPMLTRSGIVASEISLIENWAPLDDMVYFGEPVFRSGPVQFLYSGTLGYKHNPELLSAAAALPGVAVTVCSEGRVADELARTADPSELEVRPWVPFDALPATLAQADILLAMIEADAGIFSVPSKVLTYLCAGRPVLASVPPENLAGRILLAAGAGLVSAPGDTTAFLANARRLADSEPERRAMGRRARAYAERTFDIEAIADRFEAVIYRTARARGGFGSVAAARSRA